MQPTKIKSLSTVALTALLMSISGFATVIPAHAYDDDVEFVCGERDDGTDWCVSIEDLKAECALSDPEGVSDECAGLETSIGGNRGQQIFKIGARDASRHLAIISGSTSNDKRTDDGSTGPTDPNTSKPGRNPND